jgi:hypothetical protein
LDTIIRCGTTERTAMEPPFSLISCLYHLYHLGLVPLSSYVWSRSGNRVQHFLCFCYIRNCSSPACNKSLIWSCQFTVALDYQTIPEKTCVDSQMTFVKFLPLFSTHHYEQREYCGTHLVRYLLLSKVPEQVYGYCCLSNPSIFHSGFGFCLFYRVWVPLLHTFWLLLLCLKSLSISRPSLNCIQVESWEEIVSNHEDIWCF